jgi:hypothetical protein
MNKEGKSAPSARMRPSSDGARLAPAPSTGRAKKPPSNRCTATTRAGKPCVQFAMAGRGVCFLHTGDNAQRLGAKGGMRRAIFNPDKLLHFEAPKTVDEVLSILGQVSVEIHRGDIDPRVAATLTTTLTALLNGIEVKEQGALLEELERRCGLQDSMSQLRDQVTGRFTQ